MYSFELRRTCEAIIVSSKKMLDLIIFFIFMTLVWGIVGYMIIGNLDSKITYEVK